MKTRWYFILVVGLSLIPLVSIFLSPLLPHTHDGLVHLPRMAAFYKALVDGQFPVRWAADLNYGYGMPLFNFIYQLPYFISSFFIYWGLGLVQSFKITLTLSYILSGFFMFLFAKEFVQDNKKAFLITVLYQFFPFRFVELLVRGSFGEVYTYTFMPLVLYAILSFLRTGEMWRFTLTSVAVGLLILSHNSVSLLFFGICSLFVLWFRTSKKNTVLALLALGIGLMLSFYYWFPAIMDHKYTYGNLLMKNLYKEHFAPFQNFLIPNITNNSYLHTGGIATSIGLMHFIAVVLSISLLVRKKFTDYSKILLFALILLSISFFFMQPVSKVFWENISYLRQFQFPWRFLSVTGFATSLFGISYFYFIKKPVFYWIVIIAIIASTIVYWKPSLGYDKIDEGYYWNFPLNTTYYGETDLIWSAGPAKKYPEKKVEFVSGRGIVSNYSRASTKHVFTVHADVDSVVVDHTQYFPGWLVYVDKKKVPVQFQDGNWRGIITFPVKKGEHSVEVVFEETKTRQIANIISLTTAVFLLSTFFITLRNKYV